MKIKVKALISFAGQKTMKKGEIREVQDKDFDEYIKIGYVEKVVTKKVTTKK